MVKPLYFSDRAKKVERDLCITNMTCDNNKAQCFSQSAGHLGSVYDVGVLTKLI